MCPYVHKLVAIIVIRVVVGALGLILPGLSLTVDSTLLILFYAVLFVSAGGATAAIAPARTPAVLAPHPQAPNNERGRGWLPRPRVLL